MQGLLDHGWPKKWGGRCRPHIRIVQTVSFEYFLEHVIGKFQNYPKVFASLKKKRKEKRISSISYFKDEHLCHYEKL